MITRMAVVALVIVTLALFQTAVFPYLTISGFRPDLLLLVVMAFALRDGPIVGLRVGFAAGLLADLLLDFSAVGITALVFLGVGYIVGVVRPYLSDESFSAPLVLSGLTGFLGTAGVAILSGLLGEQPFGIGLIVEASVLVALYNVILSPIVVGLVTRLVDRFPAQGLFAAP